MLVLRAISGPDPGDVSSLAAQIDFDAHAPVAGLTVGVAELYRKHGAGR